MEEKTRIRQIYKATLVGSVINFLLVVFKFIAGIMGHSAAMIADAVHSLSDFVTDIIVIVFVHISNMPADDTHDYGHGKYETLATAIIGIALFTVGIFICMEGVEKVWMALQGSPLEAPAPIALWAALLSIAAKEIAFQYTAYVGKKCQSQAVIANAWHHRSDALSSIGTALGIGGAILLGEKFRILDPIAAIVVSFFIMRVSWFLLRPCMEELLEKSLPVEIENEIVRIILSEPEVSQPHHLRTRRIGNLYAIDVHIRMNGDTPLSKAHHTTTLIENKLKAKYGEKTFISLHVEPLKNNECYNLANKEA